MVYIKGVDVYEACMRVGSSEGSLSAAVRLFACSLVGLFSHKQKQGAAREHLEFHLFF